ncbi:MAG TPA: hypothetical protein PKC79_03760 [Solidesulfovibrio magneticus]|nr:hypothetical protein [Solidesulfovibrio magneticus]
MKRMITVVLVLIIGLSSLFILQGCESEQAKLETERTRLEVEKLKREAEQEAAQKELREKIYSTDKLKKAVSKQDPF